MNSQTTKRFRELLAALPFQVRKQAREAYRLFRQNPAHPGLHFKKVHDDPTMYSAAGFRRIEDILILRIGTRARLGEGAIAEGEAL
jgi:hypothetical protein